MKRDIWKKGIIIIIIMWGQDLRLYFQALFPFCISQM